MNEAGVPAVEVGGQVVVEDSGADLEQQGERGKPWEASFKHGDLRIGAGRGVEISTRLWISIVASDFARRY